MNTPAANTLLALASPLRPPVQQKAEGLDGISVAFKGERKLIPIGDVLLLKAKDNYVEVYHSGGMHLADQSLKHFERQLEGFMRVHRNALVPMDRLTKPVKINGFPYLILEHVPEPVAVSRRHVAEVRRAVKLRRS